MARLAILGEAIARREDCAGLRQYLRQTFDTLVSGEADELITLDQLAEDEEAEIVHVGASLRGRKKFADLGLVPGTTISLAGSAPLFGDLLRVRLLGR